MKKEDVIYIAILLDQQSREKCRKIGDDITKGKKDYLAQQFVFECEHMTLAFGDSVTQELVQMVGTPVTALHPSDLLMDNYDCAGLFFKRKELTSREIPFMGKYLHITIMHPAFIPPKEVGCIPERNHACYKADPTYSMSGVIAAYTQKGWVTKQ